MDLSSFNGTSPPDPMEQDLRRHVNPSDYSDTWGIDLYIDTLPVADPGGVRWVRTNPPFFLNSAFQTLTDPAFELSAK